MPSMVAPWVIRRAGGRAVEPDVVAAVPAEHDRGGAAEDHAAAAAGEEGADSGLGAGPQVFVLVAGG
jgi:hypothetical protein